jgi:hypothetical protein
MTSRVRVSVVLILACCSQVATAGTVVLKRAWIEKYRNRVTIDATGVSLDEVKSKVNPIGRGGQDGDLHMAARTADVGLPFVAEIVNAAQQSAAQQAARGAQSSNTSVAISGVWRLWFEHPPSSGSQIQGANVAVAETTNPDHVFEIHPITKLGSQDVRTSFHPIESAGKGASKEYQAYDAATAFDSYEKIKITIQPSNTAVTLSSPKAGYNYAEFYAILGTRADASDGTFVLCHVADEEGNDVTSAPIRMVFVKGSAPEQKLRTLKQGATMHLLGIPRVDLDRIANAVSKMSVNQRVTTKLPYEMIVVGVYNDAE